MSQTRSDIEVVEGKDQADVMRRIAAVRASIADATGDDTVATIPSRNFVVADYQEFRVVQLYRQRRRQQIDSAVAKMFTDPIKDVPAPDYTPK